MIAMTTITSIKVKPLFRRGNAKTAFIVNVRFANIINIINDKEVIPELLQKECNAEEIYKTVTYFLKNPELIEKQLVDCKKTLEGIKSKSSSSSEAALILNNYLVS